ncbi:hypothetical protein ID866_4225 [Astraeus odoratus]|nr:hypothetical protein ID866_4225 [Astraeus odoratus]
MRIVHHDLKLENVLVTPNGHVALCDFGNVCTFSPNLAEKEWNDNTMKGRGGTDGYLSPEQYVGDGSHNYKVDIYGFGLMLLDLFMPLGTVSLVVGRWT